MDYITKKKIELECDTEKVTILESRLRRTLKPDDLELWVAKAFAEDHKTFLETFFFNEYLYLTENLSLWIEIRSIASGTGYIVLKNKGRNWHSDSWKIKRFCYKECKAYRIEARRRFFGE